MKRIVLLFALAACDAALARAPEGQLDLILEPHNGRPAIVVPGGEFQVLVAARADLRLEGGPRVIKLTGVERRTCDGRVVTVCTVPKDALPGMYTLAAESGSKRDRNVRAVNVVGAFPDTYRFVHITDTHIGSHRGGRDSAATFAEVIRVVNQSEAVFALVTGDLTDGGEPAQFRRFLEILDTCRMATFVCPGNHDRQGLNYERVFSPMVYSFRFGRDAYLGFDTKDYNVADELGGQDSVLEASRQAMQGSRWSIGFSHRYEPDMGMRAQLVLFVDHPLDHFFYGHTHRANLPGQERVPWGTTPITITPAAVNGVIRYVDITTQKISPHSPERVVELH